jgi:hypothetical protein
MPIEKDQPHPPVLDRVTTDFIVQVDRFPEDRINAGIVVSIVQLEAKNQRDHPEDTTLCRKIHKQNQRDGQVKGEAKSFVHRKLNAPDLYQFFFCLFTNHQRFSFRFL